MVRCSNQIRMDITGMRQQTRMLRTATLAGLLSACTSAPPSTVPELAAQLSRDRVLFDQARVAEIIGSPDLKWNSPTRIPDVLLRYYDSRGRNNQIREVEFNLIRTCTRVADFVQRFGEPSDRSLITDGGGLSYIWDIPRRGGNVRVVLSRMQRPDECAPDLWVAQPFP